MKNDGDYLTLINSALRGDTQARDLIACDSEIDNICKRLYRKEHFKCPDKDQDDLIQEARLKVFREIAKVSAEFESVDAFYAWVYVITKRHWKRVIDKDIFFLTKRVCKRAGDEERFFLEKNAGDSLENLESYSERPSYEDRVLLGEIREKVRTFDTLDRQIFFLRFVEDLPVEKIAKKLNCYPVKIYRRLEKIAEMLAEHNPYRDESPEDDRE
ncbi:MAG TPA: sigma-70 family RNA polymerase sigma factor [Blastocatellia bacterium]|nr:sigma-70 family RNA polymerase sigma factor [Blastocatellia bacterium]